jgi:hypothetical protein
MSATNSPFKVLFFVQAFVDGRTSVSDNLVVQFCEEHACLVNQSISKSMYLVFRDGSRSEVVVFFEGFVVKPIQESDVCMLFSVHSSYGYVHVFADIAGDVFQASLHHTRDTCLREAEALIEVCASFAITLRPRLDGSHSSLFQAFKSLFNQSLAYTFFCVLGRPLMIE